MTMVPLTVFIFIVVFALGGPTEFMQVVSRWTSDIGNYVFYWLRSL